VFDEGPEGVPLAFLGLILATRGCIADFVGIVEEPSRLWFCS